MENFSLPTEMQIEMLRKRNINLLLDTYEVLSNELGAAGEEIFKKILRLGYKRIIEITQYMDFSTLAETAGLSDKVFGLETAVDFIEKDQFQYSITYCPYLEECQQRGLDMRFCHLFEDVYIEEISNNIGKFEEPARMCNGNDKCVFKMTNTFKK